MDACKLVIVSASHRAQSSSFALSNYLTDRLVDNGLYEKNEIFMHDLGNDPLAMWQPGFSYEFAEKIEQCEGLILISPEWHGMATPALKNWFLYLGLEAIAHKPVLLCGVSSGKGGLYPVLDVRSFSFKNHRPVYLPETIVVQDVNTLISGEAEQVRCNHKIDYALLLLRQYSDALKAVRQQLSDVDRPNMYGN